MTTWWTLGIACCFGCFLALLKRAAHALLPRRNENVHRRMSLAGLSTDSSSSFSITPCSIMVMFFLSPFDLIA